MKHLEKEISKREAHVTAESYSSLLRYFFFFFMVIECELIPRIAAATRLLL